jgi:hypothetical protein
MGNATVFFFGNLALPRFRLVVSRRGCASCKRHCGTCPRTGTTVCKVTQLQLREMNAPDLNHADQDLIQMEKQMQ